MRGVLGVAVLVLVGCGNAGGPSWRAQSATAPTQIVWANASGLDGAARARAEAAWRFALETEARNRGLPALHVDVLTLQGWDVGTLPDHPGHDGWSDWSRGVRVEALVGGDLSVPAAYHELCHVRSTLGTHDDPRWTLWEAEAAGCAAAWRARP